ncbi:tubulin delta chain-like [Sipha flava]|uniref:Tubulin delta chain-like n=2 Tax=Sipha flava TaxID=143950 RepID=A0A8B8G1G5_9HEMI|nr:tubulin delta chain-like [Sipha flava]
MSVLTICFGTCGVRFIHSFYSTIFNDNNIPDPIISKNVNKEYKHMSESNFFELKSNGFLEPRSVLIDIGNPNIGDALRQYNSCQWGFGQNALEFNFVEGSTNNWSYCYYIKGPEMFEDVCSRLKTEINKIDKIEYFLIILSPSGGCAGSACFILEKLKHDYPKISFILVLIMPYQSKDAIQNYNISFTINKLYNLTECIFLFENSVLHKVCQDGHSDAKVLFDDLNEIGSKQLISVFQPVENQTFPYFLSLVPNQKYKLLKLLSSPNYRKEYSSYESTPRWEAIVNQSIRSLNISPCVSSGNLVVYRGSTSNPINLNFAEKLNNITFSNSILEENKFLQLFQPRHFMGSKYLSVLSNNSTNVSVLNNVVKLASRAFSHKAFVHHYTQYNTNINDFKDVFSNVNQIIKDYYELE